MLISCYNLWDCSIAGADSEGPWFLPDILVNVRRPGDDTTPGVIREVLPVVHSFISYLGLLNFIMSGINDSRHMEDIMIFITVIYGTVFLIF